MATVVPATVIGTRPSKGLGDLPALLKILSDKKLEEEDDLRKVKEIERRRAVADSLAASLGEGQRTSLDQLRPVVDAQTAAARAAAAGASPNEAQVIANIVAVTNAPARAQATARALGQVGIGTPSGFDTASPEFRARFIAEQFEIRKTGRSNEEDEREGDALIAAIAGGDRELAVRLKPLIGTSPETVGKAVTQIGQDRRTKTTVDAAGERSRLDREARERGIERRAGLRTEEAKRKETVVTKQSKAALKAAAKTKLMTAAEVDSLKGASPQTIRQFMLDAQQRRRDVLLLKAKGGAEHNRAVNLAASNMDILGPKALQLLTDGNGTVKAVQATIDRLRKENQQERRITARREDTIGDQRFRKDLAEALAAETNARQEASLSAAAERGEARDIASSGRQSRQLGAASARQIVSGIQATGRQATELEARERLQGNRQSFKAMQQKEQQLFRAEQQLDRLKASAERRRGIERAAGRRQDKTIADRRDRQESQQIFDAEQQVERAKDAMNRQIAGNVEAASRQAVGIEAQSDLQKERQKFGREQQVDRIIAADNSATRRRKAATMATELKRRRAESDGQKLIRGSNLFSETEVRGQDGVGLAAAKALVSDRRASIIKGEGSKFDQEVAQIMNQHGLDDQEKFTPEQIAQNRFRAVNVVTGRVAGTKHMLVEFGGSVLPSGEFVLPEDETGKLKYRLAVGDLELKLLAGEVDRGTLFKDIAIFRNDFVENARMIGADFWKILPTRDEIERQGLTVVTHPQTRRIINALQTRFGMSLKAANEYLRRIYKDGTADLRIGAARADTANIRKGTVEGP